MANIPIRDLGAVGVVTDTEPFNLPINAFSRANNVRFHNGKIGRSPVFRSVASWSSGSLAPQHILGLKSSGGYDTIFMVTDDYVINEVSSTGSLTNRSGSISASSTVKSFTDTNLADVQYINREDRVPVFRAPSGTNFADLTNWDANWRCGSLRAFGDFLVAVNITEGSTSYPNRVRFSDIATANAVPSSWDAADATKSAGFNDLVEMTTPIIDAQVLGNALMIYSQDQVWQMNFVGGQFIFNFTKRFSDAGVINQNCVVEVLGRHYVFDTNDIYVTDGNTHESIVEGRVKDYIFNSIKNSVSDRFFVTHNSDLEEIYFCYVSGDDMVSFTNTTGCNRAAVFNYRSNTWSFMDLPNVYGAASASVTSVTTYADVGSKTYETIGGTYYSQEAGFDRHTVMCGRADTTHGLTTHKIWGVDPADSGTLTYSMDTVATKPIKLERIGIDLDELQLPLVGNKVVNKITPQIDTPNVDKSFSFTFGASQLGSTAPSYGTAQTLNITTDYKLDSRASGRYLSHKLDISDIKDFSYSGFDLDVMVTGRR